MLWEETTSPYRLVRKKRLERCKLGSRWGLKIRCRWARNLSLRPLARRAVRRVADDLFLAFGEAGTCLLIGGLETVLASLLVDLMLVELRKLLGGQHVALVLEVTLGKNEVDLLQGAAGSLRVEEIDDGAGEAEVEASTMVGRCLEGWEGQDGI